MSSYISVDIDVDDIIGSISTKDLLEELQSRNETAAEDDGIGESLKEFIESSTIRIIESFYRRRDRPLGAPQSWQGMIHNRFENEWPWGRSVTLIDEDGCAMVEISRQDSNNYAYISGLKVHPSVQRNGRATALLRSAETQALGLGVNIVLLQVVPNTWVYDWYIRKGYSDFGKCDDGLVELIKTLPHGM